MTEDKKKGENKENKDVKQDEQNEDRNQFYCRSTTRRTDVTIEGERGETKDRKEAGRKEGVKKGVKEVCCHLGSCVEAAERAARRLSVCRRPKSFELKSCKT